MYDDILDDIDFDDGDDPVLEPMEYYMKVFIGDRADAYIQQWKRGDWLAFNPLPMLIGIPWLFYRKMYLPGMILSLLWLGFFGPRRIFSAVPLFHITDIAIGLLNRHPSVLLSLLLQAVVMLGFGFGASGAYLSHVHHKISNLHTRHQHEPKQLLRLLRKEGGVDWKILLFCLILPVFFYNY